MTPEFVIGSYHQLFQIEKSFRMAKSDLQARPIYHQTRDSIEAYLTIVLAALAVSRWIEATTGWSIRRLAGRARRYRTVQIHAGDHVITAADPLPDDLRDALSKITSTPCGAHYFGRSQVRAVYQAGPRRLRWCKGGQARASAAGQGILPGCPGPRRKGKNGCVMSEEAQAQGHEQSGIVYAPGAGPSAAAGGAGAVGGFSYGGGRLLTGVRVHLIFWGSAWLAWPPPNATVGACTDAVVTILASDYMNSLGQYSVGHGSLGSVTVVTDSVGGSPADPPNPFSNDDVWQLVEHLRAAGRIPTADFGSSGQGLYMVVMPAGVGSNQPGVIGEHSYYWFGSPATNVPFGWVTQNNVDSFSVVFSHELVEACTDPEGTGWTSATACGAGHGGWCEIGDVCQGSDARVHGVLVQRFWSNADNQCVVPDDPKVAQDSKIRKDSKDSKDHKDTKDRKDHKEKDNPKELKDGAKEKEAPKELERPSSGPDVVAELRQVAEQLQAVVERLSDQGDAEPFIGTAERPAVGDVDQV